LLSKRLEFASLIAYAPRPDDVPPELREEARRSRNLVLSLKDGRAIGEPPVTVAARIALYLRDSESTARALSGFLNPSATLVPVPRSTLGTKGALWVPEELCRELAGHGFGGGVAPLLERTESIPKAAKSFSMERPTAQRNYETLRVRRTLLDAPTMLLLVDDVVTAGATLLGSASRVHDSYPDVPIRAFAAARTVSVASHFRTTVEPVVGTIVLRDDGRTQREP
jgi:hypothetical protein